MRKMSKANAKLMALMKEHPNLSVAQIHRKTGFIGIPDATIYRLRSKLKAESIPVTVEEEEAYPHLPEIGAVQVAVGEKPLSANEFQMGGNHYRRLKIQPWDYIVQNDLGFLEGQVIKYVTRWRGEGGVVGDLEKARHCLIKLTETAYMAEMEKQDT